MQHLQELHISSLSPKLIVELFSCHKKLAKTIYEKIKKISKDKIIYTKENLQDGSIKASFFIFENIAITNRINFCFLPNAKELLYEHSYKIQQNVVLREDFVGKDDSYINEYNMYGNILVKMYNNCNILETYEYDDNDILTKMTCYVNAKPEKISEYRFNEIDKCYSVIEKDLYGNILNSCGGIPQSNFMRPERLAFEINN